MKNYFRQNIHSVISGSCFTCVVVKYSAINVANVSNPCRAFRSPATTKITAPEGYRGDQFRGMCTPGLSFGVSEGINIRGSVQVQQGNIARIREYWFQSIRVYVRYVMSGTYVWANLVSGLEINSGRVSLRLHAIHLKWYIRG